MTASFNDGSGNNNYSNFSDCYWLIQPPNAVLIILNFDSFSTEPSYDRVWIYDGPTTNDPLLGVFSGNSVPPEITSSGGVLLVHFTSDMSVTAAGWSATYSASTTYCYGTTILTTGSGSFNDGSGSQNYANFSDCYWLIQPPFATTITIGFNSFSTEPVYDKVWIYDGPSVSSTLLGVFSGTTIPSEITSSGGTMLVRFTSDATNTFAGWSAYYTSAISYCSGTVVLTSPTGAFDDGSGNNNYSNNSYCYWLIEPPGAVAITLSFVSFVTEAGYDYVEIYDGSDNYAPLLGHFTGSSLPGEVTSSGGSMLVYFHSDNSLTFAGWAAEYYSNFCSGTDTLTSASGNLTDGSGIYNYGNNSDCYWLIQSPGAVSVTLVFSSFWTETGYDYVNVYDGNNILSPLIGSFSGFSTPDTITSVNGSIFIWFHSDYAENRPGWEAEYSSVSATVPIAGFIADNSVVCAGSFISFTNLTAGLNVNYSWSFGDGYFSNEQNPSHLYFDPGVYTIQLIASNIAGSDTLTIIDYIVVMPSSVVSITIFANPSDQICEGTNVTFNAISSNTGSFPVYQWTVNHENVGTNAPEYSGSELLDGDMVMCEVMSDIECAWDNPAMSNTIFMMVYPLPMINITTTPSTCNICANGSIELSVTGGSGNYIYIWSDGSTEQDIDSLISGLYIVTVIDENGCTGTEQDSVTVQTLDSQILDLVAGWSFFSTYINPVNPDINQILNSVISHVIIVKDGNGNVFWPQYNVNNIGNITTGKGYQLKMDTLQMIIVNGIMIIPENTPLFLNAGWDIIAYLRQSQANIETMMSPVISNIIIMKDGDGYVYWPQYGVNNIVNMQPGKGYQIKTSGACILTYPSNSEVFEKSENNTPQTLHFPKPNNTGNNMTLGVGHGAWSTGHGAWNMKPGDEIGIYTEAAVLAGAAVYSNVFTVITVWGDDELTPEKDGLEPGEMFIIKIWDGSTVKVLEDFIWEYGDQYYEPDKLCVIKDFTGFVSDEIMLFQNVPNPFDDQTVIGFYLPVSTYAELCVYNVLGEKIETLESGYLKDGVHRTIYKIKQIPVGTYIYRLTTNEEIHTGVMIHLR
jgi:PKD repeat protein